MAYSSTKSWSRTVSEAERWLAPTTKVLTVEAVCLDIAALPEGSEVILQ